MSSPAPATISQRCCLLCGQPGETLYRDLHDQLYGAEGRWQLSQCRACAVAWLDPRPDNVGRLYAEYYTHGKDDAGNWRGRLRRRLDRVSLVAGKMSLGYPVSDSMVDRLAARLFNLGRPGREMGAMRFAALHGPAAGGVLEIGCGSGTLLASLKEVGWRVAGIDIDPKAVAVARARGFEVREGTVQSVAQESRSFQYVILNHVIEHVPNPVDDLRECGRLLAPGGRVVVLTPNLSGFGHKRFRRFWRGLEIPRHLVIFSPASLRAIGEAAGLQVVQSGTLIRGARFIYTQSARMRSGLVNIERFRNSGTVEKLTRLAASYIFQGVEWLATLFNRDRGE